MKKTKTAIESTETLISTIDEVARLEVSLRAKTARRDKAIQLVREEHDGPIEEMGKRIKALTKLAETYCLARRAEVFPGKDKSHATALARFGFRVGNPTLSLLNRKWTWDAVKTAIIGCDLFKFIRTVQEVDKDALKSSKLTDAELAAIGLRLDATERFFIDSKSEDADRITSEVAATEG
jgi:phage host-nuclease inhibitor protein Gam